MKEGYKSAFAEASTYAKAMVDMSADKPSRFVVDLKEKIFDNNTIKKENKILKVKKIIKTIKQQDYKSKINKTKENLIGCYRQSKNIGKKSLSDNQQLKNETKYKFFKNEKINELAFINLLNLLLNFLYYFVKISYKLCYYLGWSIVFLIRFIYFLSRFVINSLAKPALVILPQSKSLVLQIIPAILSASSFVWWKIVDLSKNLINKKEFKNKEEILPIVEKAVQEENFYDTPFSPFRSKFSYAKAAVLFSLILLIIILPVKAYTFYKSLDDVRGKVLGESEQAFNDMFSAGQAAQGGQFNQASNSFTSAGNKFFSAENRLNEINNIVFSLAAIAPNKDLKLAAASRDILQAGQLTSELGNNLSLAIDSLLNSGTNNNIGQIIDNFFYYANKANDNVIKINKVLADIPEDALPDKYYDQFISLKNKVGIMAADFNEFVKLTDNLKNFLGTNSDKRYLLVFQNNSELRASGGFMGSYGLVDLRNGNIKNIETPGGGSYDTEAGLAVKITAPEPLWLVNPLWHFWDANWWPDWPTTAAKLMWFYEKSDGPTVDGVISFTPTVIEKLLAAIGPIDMEKDYGAIITADNFWEVTQTFSEQKPNVTTKPKKIIGDLLNKIVEEMPKRLNRENLIILLNAIDESLRSKNMLFYFTDPDLEKALSASGYDGKIKETANDYLAVINTNIAGGKSDRVIKELIEHQAEISADGSVINELTITRTHTGIKRQPFSGVRNVDWMRVYVPLGSELISAQGFNPVDSIYFEKPDPSWQTDPQVAAGEGQAVSDELSGTKIYNELGKTVFANWLQTDPGQTSIVKIKYLLPFKIDFTPENNTNSFSDKLLDQASAILNPRQKQVFPYSLLMQKQPGANSTEIVSNLKIFENSKIIWKYPEDLETKDNIWEIKRKLDSDMFWAVVFEVN